MRRYSFSIAGFFVLVVLVVLLSALLRPRSETTYGTGQHSFQAAFATKPTVVIMSHTNVGLGGFTPGTLRRVVMWRDTNSSVWIAVVRGTTSQVTRDLRTTATNFRGSFSARRGIETVRFTQELGPTAHARVRFTDGLIQVKGTTLFYALGASNSEKAAQRFIRDFHVVKY